MGGIGRWVGFAWFFLLFLAAITSSISMLQPVKTFFEEALGISSGKAIAAVSVICGLGSFWVMWFSKDMVALNTMDFWVGTFCIFLLATVQIICFGWVWGVEKGAAELDQGALMKIPRPFFFIMKYVAPAYLLVVLGGFIYFNGRQEAAGLKGNPVALWTVVVIGVGDRFASGDGRDRRAALARGRSRSRRAAIRKGVKKIMTTGGWIFMLSSLILVWGTTIWAYRRLLTAPREDRKD